MKIIDVAPMKIINVGLGGIAVNPERLRALRKNKVAELAESMKARGLLQPIVLRTHDKGSGYILIAGRHRFEAAKLLKWEGIPAVVYEGMKADEAELAEIDENLIRAGLSEAEQAMHYARRKELYEKLYPETKSTRSKGGGGRRRRNGSQDETHSRAFIDDAAKKSGEGRSTVARKVARGEKVVVLSKIAGTCLDNGTELDALAKLPPDEQRQLAERARAGEKVSARTRVKQVKRQEREQTLAAKVLALPQTKYGVIVEDFEWDHETWSEAGKTRHASNHYPTSSDAHTAEEIVKRTKDRFVCAAANCALFMWSTVPHLAVAIDVMRLRGFAYRSHVIWEKDRVGTGYWSRNKHEVLLIGVRGEVPCPAPGTQWDSLIMAPRGRHSAKPECFLEMIESYFPTVPKIELGRRGAPRPSWDAWGDEVPRAPPLAAGADDGIPGFLDRRPA